MDIFLIEKTRIGKYAKCSTNEDLFFPLVKFTTNDSVINNNEYKLVGPKDCLQHPCQTPRCRVKSTFHPRFVELGLSGCYKCEEIKEIIQKILTARGYILIEIGKGVTKIVKFRCCKLHEDSCTYRELRQGKTCIQCYRESVKRIKQPKIVRQSCDCKALNLTWKRKCSSVELCIHYNFAVLFPEKATDWDYVLNEELPNRVSPCSATEYWFNCSQCKVIYKQRLDTRKSCGCPYCSHQKLDIKSSLAFTHNSIAQEWDLDNNFKYPTEVSYGSGEKVWWLCNEEKETHRYLQIITNRTGSRQNGCYCKNKCHAQKIGGHDHFVAISSQVHNNKYSYPDIYKNLATKINIHCPVIDPQTNIVHGLFLQNPWDHKNGSQCGKCLSVATISKGMINLKHLLNSLGYIENKDYSCEQILPGLKYVGNLRLDIYLKIGEIKIAIEFDGQAHFKPIELWGGEEALFFNKERDSCKDIYCIENNISMIRIPYTKMPTKEYLQKLIEYCQFKQVYMSYPHLIIKSKEKTDLSKVELLVIEEF